MLLSSSFIEVKVIGNRNLSPLHLADCVAETLRKLKFLPIAHEQGRQARGRNTINQNLSKVTPLSIAEAQKTKARTPKPKAEGFKVGKDVKKSMTKPEHNYQGYRGAEAAKSASEKQKQLEEQLTSTLPTFSQINSVNQAHNYPDAPQPPPPPPSTPIQSPSRQTSDAVLEIPSNSVHEVEGLASSSSSAPHISPTEASEPSLKLKAITDSSSGVVTTSILNELLSNSIFRDPAPDRDEADDEQDDADLEHYDKCDSSNIEFNPDEDDQGLHERLKKIAIGKRRRDDVVNKETAVGRDGSGHLEETGVIQDRAVMANLGDGQDGGTDKVEGPGRRVRRRRNANAVDEACNAKAIEGIRFGEVPEPEAEAEG